MTTCPSKVQTKRELVRPWLGLRLTEFTVAQRQDCNSSESDSTTPERQPCECWNFEREFTSTVRPNISIEHEGLRGNAKGIKLLSLRILCSHGSAPKNLAFGAAALRRSAKVLLDLSAGMDHDALMGSHLELVIHSFMQYIYISKWKNIYCWQLHLR